MDNGSNNGYYRLKDLVNIKWIMPPTPIFKECGIKYITSKNIKNSTIDFYNCKFISLDDYEKINKNWKIKTNDLLLSMIGTIGEIAIVDYKYGKFTGQNFVVIIPKKIITKYLFYLFHKNKTKKFLIDNSIGSTQKYLSLPILKSIPIYSPPLPTQQKIIDIIEPHQDLYLKFSNCIRIDTYENSKYDMQILIDIIEPIEKLEFGINNLIKKMEEFLINRSLSLKTIDEYANWKTMGYAYSTNQMNKNGKYKIYTLKNMHNNLSFSRTNLIKNNLLKPKDIMIGRLAGIGNTGIILDDNWVASCNAIVYRSDYFLNIKCSVYKQKNKLLKKATGAVQQLINKTDIFNTKMIKTYIFDKVLNDQYFNFLKINELLKKIKTKLIKLLVK